MGTCIIFILSRIAGHVVTLVFKLWGTDRLVFKMSSPMCNLTTIRLVRWGLWFCHSLATSIAVFGSHQWLWSEISLWFRLVFPVMLNIWMCFLATSIFGERSFQILHPFLNWDVCLFIVEWCKNFLDILDTKTIIIVWLANIVSHSGGSFFVLLCVLSFYSSISFEAQKFD
jgi:hypothetical protein